MKAAFMPTIVDFPTIVQEALAVFGNVFETEAARRHFAAYLTGLMVAERKTVSGINREFALTTDQSCLNRWLPEVQWDVQTLNLIFKFFQVDITGMFRMTSSARYLNEGVGSSRPH